LSIKYQKEMLENYAQTNKMEILEENNFWTDIKIEVIIYISTSSQMLNMDGDFQLLK
jgi:hypothetical protein